VAQWIDEESAMTESAGTPSSDAHAALERIRALVAERDPDRAGDVDVIAAALQQRDALKAAGDAMIYEISHPKRRGSHMMEAVVAFRRVSEGMGG
jgi:hypothetical protein